MFRVAVLVAILSLFARSHPADARSDATVATAETRGNAEHFETRSTEGGTLTGKVTFEGVPPAPKTFPFVKFPTPGFCSKFDSNGHGSRVV